MVVADPKGPAYGASPPHWDGISVGGSFRTRDHRRQREMVLQTRSTVTVDEDYFFELYVTFTVVEPSSLPITTMTLRFSASWTLLIIAPSLSPPE